MQAATPHPGARPARKGRAVRARRGMTFLEVVAAVAVLALMTGTVLGAVSLVQGMQLRQTHTLACAELANRMMLQYLDDKSSVPSPITPLEYGAHRYRFSLAESSVGFVSAESTSDTGATQRVGRSPITPDRRYKQVTVKVWLSEESGGSQQLVEGVPHVQIARLIDLLAFRNPDSAQNMLSQPGAMQQLLEAIGAGGAQTGSGNNTGTRPPPTPTPRSGGGTR